ncbi:MAG: hypothetical protein JO104_05940, partial [Candidatus Eremiobacteraeota bacterium]|nr:hypothetical protein [Candidatus Eremiobacteraeota bacterium]
MQVFRNICLALALAAASSALSACGGSLANSSFDRSLPSTQNARVSYRRPSGSGKIGHVVI